MARTVAIAGGGLAGLTCAKYLADAGFHVTLWEGLPYFGGRASTYRDADGDWIEQGLHLFLGTYSAFKQLLEEVGQPPDEILFWRDEVHVQDTAGPAAVYGVNPLRAPLKTVLSFLRQNTFLGPWDKASLAPLALPALTSLDHLREKYEPLTVVDWWQQVKGTEDVLERLLRPFCRGIQFTDAEQFSAYVFLALLHQMVYHLPQNRLGGYLGAREEIIFQPLMRYLQQRQVVLRPNMRLERLLWQTEPRQITGLVFADGTQVTADLYVIAIPAWGFVPLIPAPWRQEAFFAQIAALPIAPAIAVQIWFDRPAAETPDYFLVARTPAVVYQEQSLRTYPTQGGGRISVIVAPADELLAWDEAALVQMVVNDLSKANPRLRGARITKSVVLKHRQHLIRPLPGAMSQRPTQTTPMPNLFLAGDWTQQQFFGSQEGAVRSGKACAEAICQTCTGNPGNQ
jgi:15-cis-phytoene desaturase